MKIIIAIALPFAIMGCTVNHAALRDFNDALERTNAAMAPAVKERMDRTDAQVEQMNRGIQSNRPVNCQTVYYPGGSRTQCQ